MGSYLEPQWVPTCLVTLQPQGVVPRVGPGTCQPGAAQDMELEPGAEPVFAFANEADSPVPAHANLSWPGSQDLTAEVPGHSPLPSCLGCFSPASSLP